MNRMPKIACDLDGFLFDFHRYTCDILEKEGVVQDTSGLTEHNMHDFWPESRERVLEIAADPRTYLLLPEIYEGILLLRILISCGFQVTYVTARRESARTATQVRLQKAFGNSHNAVTPGTDLISDEAVVGSFGNLILFGSSDAKVEYLLKSHYDFVLEDNPQTLHALRNFGLKARPSDAIVGYDENQLMLVGQVWNRSEKSFKRRTYSEILFHIFGNKLGWLQHSKK